ncbi:MAG: NADH-quinone oxidoreductase subunit NuoH [Bacteroidota bacterium]
MDLPVYLFLVLNGLLLTASALVYAERRVAGIIQERVGPNRVGPQGLLQPFADVFKLIFKEDIRPSESNRFLHSVAPTLMVVIAMTTVAVMPVARGVVVADISVGVLLVLALTSLSVYGITIAGWSSNSKYSLLGGLRSSAQMVSYELGMGAAVVSVVLLTSATLRGQGLDLPALSMTGIVEAQNSAIGVFAWNLFRNPVGFVIFVVCAFAETNRAPFDLPEAEQELVGGYHTEYAGMKFGMFFLAEYVNMFMASVFITTLFLGGYLIPFEALFVPGMIEAGLGWLVVVLQVGSFLLKAAFCAFVFIWVRWTLPRFKYNQLMKLGWAYLLPIAIANILVIALGIALWYAVA